MKARINENNVIEVFSSLPNVWKNHINFSSADASLYQSEGFYDVHEPSYNPTTQKLGAIFFDEEFEVFTYPVVDKTQAEIDYEVAMAGWHYPDYAKRIKVPLADINTDPVLQGFVSQLLLWWTLNKLEHHTDTEHAYFYCNFIYPAHESILAGFETVEVEDVQSM